MSVKELIARLQQMPQDAEVVQAIDEEGNGYARTAVVRHQHISPYEWMGPREGREPPNSAVVLFPRS